MFNLPGALGTLADLAVILIGFSAIIFVHELGHFLAARWAGIRVLAFSMGMGPVVFSYRKGIGFRRGSSEPEYLRAAARTALADEGDEGGAPGISPTEYRFSALPLGGYVKMLGQEDANPGAVSDAPDSYQNTAVWKRMVVICAGVVMNLITAAGLFIIVFMVGLKVQPPIVGRVAPDSPAAAAVAVNRPDVGRGLRPEDVILEVGGHRVRAFNEVATEVAMSGRHRPVPLLVQRPGHPEPILFEAEARADETSGLRDLGVMPAFSTTLAEWEIAADRDRFAAIVGLSSVGPGDRLVAVNGVPVARPSSLTEAAAASGGRPVHTVFRSPDGQERAVTVQPVRALQQNKVATDPDRVVLHLLGLRPLLRVDPSATPEDTKQGLRPGDVLVRIADVDAPARDEAMAAIRAHAGKAIEVEVLRDGRRQVLPVKVNRNGTIGFMPAAETADAPAIVAAPPYFLPDQPRDTTAPGVDAAAFTPHRPPAADLIDRPGTRILAVAGRPVETLQDVAEALIQATREGLDAGESVFQVPVQLELPLPPGPDGAPPVETRTWTLAREDVESAHALPWTLPGGEVVLMLFETQQAIDKAATPVAAVGRGLAKSRQVMNQTYLTFLRLFQGTVRVSHLKGPVGIAHLGTQVADQGFVWVLFFLGLVSINLAVINFLPLPIVDGGQFLMLCYEAVRRRPVPIFVQNLATLAGLAMIGAVFLIVTFHDIRTLLGV